jgi:hypothetical protein
VFGDANLDREVARIRARAIAKSYGERDFLKHHIIKYLRSIGRCIDYGEPNVG